MVIAFRVPEATMVEEETEVKLETLAVDPLEVFPVIEESEALAVVWFALVAAPVGNGREAADTG